MRSSTFHEIWNHALKTGQWKVALDSLEKLQPQSDYESWQKIDFQAALLFKIGSYEECFRLLEEYKNKYQSNRFSVDNTLKLLRESICERKEK